MPRSALLLLLPLLALAVAAGPVAAQDDPPQPITIPLTVSLEWEPGAEALSVGVVGQGCPTSPDPYLADLRQGLRFSAAYLYAYTRGQITLGDVTVHTGGAQWEQADIRVLANSGYRPSAFVGGAVSAPTLREETAGRSVLYAPAPIILGRLWDGRGARCGPWSGPAGWRTIGHELAHHVLRLYDQYIALDGSPRRCTSTGLSLRIRPSLLEAGEDTLMTYHYSADELLLKSPAGNGQCAGTAHEHIYADRSEWEALRLAFPALPATPPPPVADDLDAIVERLTTFGAASVTIATPPAVADTSAAVKVAALSAPTKVYGELYLVERDQGDDLSRIVGQGWVVPGEPAPPPVWGVRPGVAGRAVAFIDNGTSGARFATPPSSSGPALSASGPGAELTAAAAAWRPSIVVKPRLSPGADLGGGRRSAEVSGLDIEIRDCNRLTKFVDLTYCPAGGTCYGPVRVDADQDGVLRETIFFPLPTGLAAPSIHGYIHAYEPTRGEEAIVWYQIGGGVGPAHGDAHAPLVDGLLNTDLPPATPGPDRDARLLFSATPVCTPLNTPASSAFREPVPRSDQGPTTNDQYQALGLWSSVIGPTHNGVPQPRTGPGAPAQLAAGVAMLGTPYSVQPAVATDQQSRPWGSDPADPGLIVRINYSQDLLDRLGIDEHDLVGLRLNDDNPQIPAFWELVPAAQLAGRDTALDWIAFRAAEFEGDGEFYALGYRTARQVFLPLVAR